MVVYLDVLLVENFIVNMFLLHITSQTVRVKTGIKFQVIAAFSGALYVITMLYPSLALFTKLPFAIIVALIMVIVLFRRKDILLILKSTALLILYSMLLSGFCVFMQYKLSSGGNIFSGYVINDFSFKWQLIAIMVLYMIMHRLIVFVQDRKEMSHYMYTVEIVAGGFTRTVRAFLDTGNELREPASNLPVMVVERNILKDLMIQKQDMLYIPYRVVNDARGRMEGFKPEFVRIYYGNNKCEIRDVVIGFCDSKLSALDDYEALLSRGII